MRDRIVRYSAEAAQPERPFAREESAPRKPAGSIEVASPGVYNIRFSAGRESVALVSSRAEVEAFSLSLLFGTGQHAGTAEPDGVHGRRFHEA